MAASEGLPLLHDPKLSPRSAAAVAAEEAAAKAKHRRNRRIAYGVVAIAVISLLVIAGSKSSSRLVLGPKTASYSDTPYARVMQEYRASHDFDGVVQVTEDGEVTFADWSGLAVEEFDVPMQADSIFPIGSNSKLFVAVALYQLQERGVVNLSDPVNLHLDAQDFANFGFPNQTSWCPRVAGAAPDSPCENITFVQLMHMGSGIGDSLNCDNVPPERCYATADNLGYYKGSLGPYIGVFINDPLVFKPDSDYSYSNPNYYLLSYLVEKLSGQSFAAYLDEHIIRKIGLNDTYFDPYSGALGVRKGYVQQYIHYYAQATAEDPRELLATGTCEPYINSGAISGSGGLRSTASDMQRWYLDLFAHRGTQSKVLSAESIRMLVDRVNPVNHMYGQGIGVGERGEDGWPSILQYCGGMKCAVTCMTMLMGKGAEATSSAVISSFSSHMHYTFADRAAFEKYKPIELLAKPPSWGIVDDGGATALITPLVREYLVNLNSTEIHE